MPKILMTADAVGGVLGYSVTLLRELSKRGYSGTLAVLGPSPGEERKAQIAQIPAFRLIEMPGRLEWMQKPWADVDAAGRRLSELCYETRPDLVHLNGYTYGSLRWPCPAVIAAHSCVASWWRAVRREPLPADWDEYTDRVSRGLERADAVVTPTAAMANSLLENYNLKRTIGVIPNGLDSGGYRPGHKESIVFAAGRIWDEAKNLSALAAAAANLEWPVYVAGQDTHPDGGRRELENLQSLGLLSHREIQSWYSRAAVFCAPACYEPFGLGILEAALSGCALVLGDIPSLREVWGDNACYVDPWDTKQLKSTLSLLTEKPARLRELSLKSQRAGLCYSANRMADAYCELYSSLIGALVS